MKKSVEILGLPIISITEGRELGVSKSLLIDAKNGVVAAITIEDEDWYRGIKLIPYESVIAIGEDAVTITHSENILKLDEAGDYERFLIENIRVIGTKAITKKGRIQGNVTEVFIGDGGKIEQCEITAPDGSTSEVSADQISIFGKQVTVIDIDGEKKNNFVTEQPAFEPAFVPAVEEPAQEVWTPAIEETPAETVDAPAEVPEVAEIPDAPVELPEVAEVPDAPVELPEVAEIPDAPVELPEVAEVPDAPVELPEVAEVPDAPVELPEVAEVPDAPVEVPEVAEVPDAPVELPEVAEIPDAPVDTANVDELLNAPVETVDVKLEEQPVVEATPEPAVEAAPEPFTPVVEAKPSDEEQRIATMTQQAADLKAALKKARNSKQATAEPAPRIPQKTQVETTVVERRRRALLGKHAIKTITADSGTVVVEAGAEVTEEVLQRARLSNKFIELSMNVQ